MVKWMIRDEMNVALHLLCSELPENYFLID